MSVRLVDGSLIVVPLENGDSIVGEVRADGQVMLSRAAFNMLVLRACGSRLGLASEPVEPAPPAEADRRIALDE